MSAFEHVIALWSFVYILANRKGIKMRARKIICCAVGAMLAATAAGADEIVMDFCSS